jgi:hypothetical protein
VRSRPRRLGLLLAFALAACGGDPPAPPAAAPPARTAPSASPPAPPGRPDEPRLGPYPRSQLYLERDLFLAADEPRVVPARDARFLAPEDEVLGLVVAGRARAYPVTMISYHHVVNDVIEGIPVAVTY